MSDQPFGLRRLAQIAVTVRDPDRAVAFYRDTLGIPLLFRAPPGLAFFDLAGVRLMLSPPEGEDGGATSVLYYAVEDIEAAGRALEARGVVFEQPPHRVAKLPDREVWIGFFRDSENNLLAIMSEPKLSP